MIKRIERYSDIMFSFEPKIRYFAEVEAAGGMIFCAFGGDGPLAVVCLKNTADLIDVSYLYTKEEHRQKGAAVGLMRHAAACAEKEGKPLHFRVLMNSAHAPACLKIADALNMRLYREAVFYRLNVNAASRQLWEEHRPKLLQLIARAEKKTGRYQVVSFADAGEDILDKLRGKIDSEFHGLNPFDLPDISPEFSFIVLPGGEPAAFNAARVIGRKMIYEISSAKKGMTIVLGAHVFLDKLFSSDIEQVSCVVYSDNTEGHNHAGGRFGFLFKESGRQAVYVL